MKSDSLARECFHQLLSIGARRPLLSMQIRLKPEPKKKVARFRPKKTVLLLALCAVAAGAFFLFKKPAEPNASSASDIASSAIRPATMAEEPRETPAYQNNNQKSEDRYAAFGFSSMGANTAKVIPSDQSVATLDKPSEASGQTSESPNTAEAATPEFADIDESFKSQTPTTALVDIRPLAETIAATETSAGAGVLSPSSAAYPQTSRSSGLPVATRSTRVVERLPATAAQSEIAAPETAAAPRAAVVNSDLFASPKMSTHKIRDGDTLASLAQRFLGSADRQQILFDHNRDVLTSADMLPIGAVIRIPSGDAFGWLAAKSYEPNPLSQPLPQAGVRNGEQSAAALTSVPLAKTHRVKRGDSLDSISREHFGEPFRAREIYRLNRDRLARPDRLPQGVVLVLP